MDKNTLIAVLLIGLLLIFYFNYNQKQAERARDTQAERIQESMPTDTLLSDDEQPLTGNGGRITEGSQRLIEDTSEISVDDVILEDLIRSYGPFYRAVEGEEEIITLESDLLKIELSTKGAQIHKVELKKYKDYLGNPLVLFEGTDENKIDFQFFLPNNRDINTSNLYFEPSSSGFKVTGNDTKVFSMILSAGEGRYLEKKFTISGNDYKIGYDILLSGFDEIIPRNNAYLSMQWDRKIKRLEKHIETESRYTTVFYRFTNEDVEYLGTGRRSEAAFSSSVEWLSFKQQFFNSTLIFKDGFYRGNTSSEQMEGDYLRSMSGSLILNFDQTPDVAYNMQFYFGPNHYQTLRSYDLGLENLVDIGKGFFVWVKFINRVSIIPIFNWLNNYFSNYGMIIFLLTLIIKLVLFPLTYKSYLSMAKMKVLKPELDELREKFKDDQQKFGAEQLKLFQKAGVNPLGGCLPMLLQMPILIAMYYFFPASIELRQEGFLWADDLSTYDSIMTLPFTIPFYGSHVSLFTLLMTASSILFAVTNAQMTGSAQGPMKYMPYIFPVFLLFIFNSFPAALTFYYFLTNLISFGQQMVIKHFFINEDKIHKQIQDNKRKPVKKSAFQKKLEDIAKQQKQLKDNKKK
ncbi:MAG: membrane protein insertase YidC [Chitinophagaceae bacterium]|nr:MAG: membrane protein insertase YidC [Chitinophagaceae bacterium]